MENNTTKTRVITVSSGKGGVGKTNVSVNTAINLAKLGKKVCIFDADLGLANVNILLGLQPQFNLSHVLSGKKTISDITIQSNYGIKIIPASSGVERLADLDDDSREKLLKSISSLAEDLDYLIIDTSSGISINVLSFVLAADMALVVLSPEPTSLTDAYALIKVMAVRKYNKPINIVVNMVSSKELAEKIFQKMESVVTKFLDVKLNFLGFVYLDKKLPQSVIYQKPISVLDPASKASRCFSTLSKDIVGGGVCDPSKSDIRSFFQRTIDILKSPVFTIKRNKVSKNIRINVPREAPAVPVIGSLKEFVDQKCNKKDISENELIDLYRFVGESYKKRFNKSICETFDVIGKGPYGKFDELVGKMENIIENEMVLAKDLNRIKDDSGKYTDELRKLVTYIDSKNEASRPGVIADKSDIIKGVSDVNFFDSKNETLSNIKVPFLKDNPNNKSRYVQELNFEDL